MHAVLYSDMLAHSGAMAHVHVKLQSQLCSHNSLGHVQGTYIIGEPWGWQDTTPGASTLLLSAPKIFNIAAGP